jgi:hypothetical protein
MVDGDIQRSPKKRVSRRRVSQTVTPRVTLFLNYLPYKLNPASSAMVNQVIEVWNQNSKSGV